MLQDNEALLKKRLVITTKCSRNHCLGEVDDTLSQFDDKLDPFANASGTWINRLEN